MGLMPATCLLPAPFGISRAFPPRIFPLDALVPYSTCELDVLMTSSYPVECQVFMEAKLVTYLQGEEETSRRVIVLLAAARYSALVIARLRLPLVVRFMNQTSKAAADSQFSIGRNILCNCQLQVPAW